MTAPFIFEDSALVDWCGFRALSYNLPLDSPGVYAIIHLSTGRPYVGISKNLCVRLKQHANGRRDQAIQKEIAHYGKSEFMIIPLFYSTGIDGLAEAEAELILDYDAIRFGFNVHPGKGSHGEKFIAAMIASHARPEIKEKRRAIAKEVNSRPEVRAKISAATTRSNRDPKRLAQFIANMADPDVTTRRIVRMREVHGSPESKAKKSARMKKEAQTPEFIARARKRMTRLNADPVFRAATLAAQTAPGRAEQRRAIMLGKFEDPAYREKIKAATNSPQAKEKRAVSRRVYYSDPENRAKSAAPMIEWLRSEAGRESGRKLAQRINSDPELNERRRAAVADRNKRPEIRQAGSARMRAYFADQQNRQNLGEAIRRSLDNPAARAKKTAIRTGTIWITDGHSNKWARPEDDIPIGWRRGKIHKTKRS